MIRTIGRLLSLFAAMVLTMAEINLVLGHQPNPFLTYAAIWVAILMFIEWAVDDDGRPS